MNLSFSFHEYLLQNYAAKIEAIMKTIFLVLGVFTVLAIFEFTSIVVYILHEASQKDNVGIKDYGRVSIQGLIALLKDNTITFQVKNDVIRALGIIGDVRALPGFYTVIGNQISPQFTPLAGNYF